jgi:hypothetical protein
MNKTNNCRSTQDTQDLIPMFEFIKNPTFSLRGSQRTGSLSTLSSLKLSQRHSGDTHYHNKDNKNFSRPTTQGGSLRTTSNRLVAKLQE